MWKKHRRIEGAGEGERQMVERRDNLQSKRERKILNEKKEVG